MKAYLDLNIVFDFLVGSRPNNIEAAQILTLFEGDRDELFTSPNAFVMGFAFLRRDRPDVSATDHKHTLAMLRRSVDCVLIGNQEVDQALALSPPEDMEDGMQIVLAQKCDAELIISNDKRGFRDSPIPQLTSPEFLRRWDEFIHLP